MVETKFVFVCFEICVEVFEDIVVNSSIYAFVIYVLERGYVVGDKLIKVFHVDLEICEGDVLVTCNMFERLVDFWEPVDLTVGKIGEFDSGAFIFHGLCVILYDGSEFSFP